MATVGEGAEQRELRGPLSRLLSAALVLALTVSLVVDGLWPLDLPSSVGEMEVKDELGPDPGYSLEIHPDWGIDGAVGASSEGEGAARELSDRSGWIRGEATYYHPSLEWDGACCLMADGKTKYWRDQSGVVAAVSWPLGSLLYACGPTGRCLQAVVSDTGYLNSWQTDWSEADFTVLAGSLGPGRIEVSVKEMQGP